MAVILLAYKHPLTSFHNEENIPRSPQLSTLHYSVNPTLGLLERAGRIWESLQDLGVSAILPRAGVRALALRCLDFRVTMTER